LQLQRRQQPREALYPEPNRQGHHHPAADVLINPRNELLPYKYKTPILRLYFQLYLDKKNVETLEIVHFLNAFVIPDLTPEMIATQTALYIFDSL
jgi:hypothetical protein